MNTESQVEADVEVAAQSPSKPEAANAVPSADAETEDNLVDSNNQQIDIAVAVGTLRLEHSGGAEGHDGHQTKNQMP